MPRERIATVDCPIELGERGHGRQRWFARRQVARQHIHHFSTVDRYTEPESTLPARADHDRAGNRLCELQLDMGVGQRRSVGTIHFDRREIECPRCQRRTHGPDMDRLRKTGVTTPACCFRQVERTPSLVNGRHGCHPTLRSTKPAARTRRDRAHLIVSGHDGHVNTATGESADGKRGIATHLPERFVGSGRQPQRQAVYASTRPPVANVRKCEVAGKLVARRAEPVAMQHRWRLSVDVLVAA